jgi:hypothetical protein
MSDADWERLDALALNTEVEFEVPLGFLELPRPPRVQRLIDDEMVRDLQERRRAEPH